MQNVIDRYERWKRRAISPSPSPKSTVEEPPIKDTIEITTEQRTSFNG